MLSCRSSSEASVQAPHFSNHSLKSLLRRWTTCSDVRANTQCSKMMCEQPPSKSWLPDRHPEVAQKEVPNFRTGQGRSIEGRKGQVARKGRPSHHFPYHMRNLSLRSKACSTSGGLDPLERTHPKEIIERDVPSTRNMVTQQRHAGASSIWSRGSSKQDI